MERCVIPRMIIWYAKMNRRKEVRGNDGYIKQIFNETKVGVNSEYSVSYVWPSKRVGNGQFWVRKQHTKPIAKALAE